MAVSIVDFGAVADGRTNNHDAIQRAFDYAQANGVAVIIPEGTFAYSGTLTARGISVSGTGDKSVLKALSGTNESLILTGTGASVSDFRMDGNMAQGRLTTFESGMLWAKNAQDFTIQNIHINGSSSVGIASTNGSSGGKILNNTIENTLADSIHMIGGSNNITVAQNRIVNSGDDGIAVVSYGDLPIVHHITVQGNTVLENKWGRGLSVVGGDTVKIIGNHVDGGAADRAAVYISAEAEYGTLGVNNVTVSGNTLVDGGGAQSGHGAITLYNSVAGTTKIANVVVENNQIVDPRADGIQIVGKGAVQAALNNNKVYEDNRDALIDNSNPAAVITTSGNQQYSLSAYPGPLVPAGGGVGEPVTTTPTPTPAPTPDETAPTPDEPAPAPTPDETAPTPAPDEPTPAPTPDETAPTPTPDEPAPAPTPTPDTTVPSVPTGASDATHPKSGAATTFIQSTDPGALVKGTPGNDLIAGVQGKADLGGLAGGKGDDTYIVDTSADKVVERSGQGVDTVVSYGPTHTLPAYVENLVLGGTAAQNGAGNSASNALTGNDASNILEGRGGNDLLVGNGGNDVLNGGYGADTMKGGLGNDIYIVNQANDSVVELSGQGVDTVASLVSYSLGRYVENLTLTGTAAINGTGSGWSNVLTGNDGDNVLRGLGGNDILTGGKGNDVLIGGWGRDTFAFKGMDHGTDAIKDFKMGVDTLDVRGLLQSAGIRSGDAVRDHILKVTQVGAHAEIVATINDATAKIAVVENVNAYDLAATSDYWS